MSTVIPSNHKPRTPAQVIMYMIDEATRKTDLYEAGEFGMANGIMWYHDDLLKRLNEYIERLKSES